MRSFPHRSSGQRSTRAKGLEFDRVLLTDPRDNDASDPGEENRVLYVAVSRARREIFHLNQPDTRGLNRTGDGALGPSRVRTARWKIREIEVTGRDTHSLHPAGAWLLRADVRDTQDYLATKVGPGDPVTLELLHQRPGEDPVAHYAIYHDGHGVGLTSEGFGRLLGRALGPRSRALWPQRIEGFTRNSSIRWPGMPRPARPTAWQLRAVAPRQGLRTGGAPL